MKSNNSLPATAPSANPHPSSDDLGASDAPPAGHWIASLRSRLLIYTALALAPMACLAGVQAYLEYRHERAELVADLQRKAVIMAGQPEDVILGAQNILTTLASQPAIASGDCREPFRKALVQVTEYANLAVLDADGNVICSAIMPDRSYNFSDKSWFGRLKESGQFVLSEYTLGDISKLPVIIAARPIPDPSSSAFRGALIISIKLRWLEDIERLADLPQNSFVTLVDSAGRVLSPDAPLSRVDMTGVTNPPEAKLHRATGRQGNEWLFVLEPLVGDEAYILLGVDQEPWTVWSQIDIFSGMFLPAIMWLIALLTIWVSADRLVLRWLRYLRRIAGAYGRGHYQIRPSRADMAPAEISQLARTFSSMADRIESRDAELRDALDIKTSLLMEIHHRVKNNLQIITSLLNIQKKTISDPKALAALEQASARINALALVHRALYQTEDLRWVDLQPYVTSLCAQLHEALGGNESQIHLHTDVIEMKMSAERAVPLALFIVEVMTNAYKHAFSESEGGEITVRVADEGASLRISISDNGKGLPDEGFPHGAGMTLIEAFVRQLGGTYETQSQSGRGTSISLRIPRATALASV